MSILSCNAFFMDRLRRSEVRIGNIIPHDDVCTETNTVYNVGEGLPGVIIEIRKKLEDIENLMF